MSYYFKPTIVQRWIIHLSSENFNTLNDEEFGLSSILLSYQISAGPRPRPIIGIGIGLEELLSSALVSVRTKVSYWYRFLYRFGNIGRILAQMSTPGDVPSNIFRIWNLTPPLISGLAIYFHHMLHYLWTMKSYARSRFLRPSFFAITP